MEPKENYVQKYLATHPVVEAIRFSGKNFKRIMEFMGMPEGLTLRDGLIYKNIIFPDYRIEVVDWIATEGDYIVKKETGTFTSINGERFNKYYKAN